MSQAERKLPIKNSRPGILLCVATEKGLATLRTALLHTQAWRIVVCTFPETGMSGVYSEAIQRVAEENNLPHVEQREFRKAPEDVVRKFGITTVLCAGWKYLIPKVVVERLRGEVFIAHDSLLPKYRGFAPLPTAIIAGDSETGVSFIRAGESVDSGDILWQESVAIDNSDTVASVTTKLLPLYSYGTEMILSGVPITATPQDHSTATYSIWRDAADYFIDWTLDSATIQRTIRALGPPYSGACSRIPAGLVRILEATEVQDLPFAIRQPGKVWAIDDQGRPIVICGQGLLRLDTAEIENVSIIPLKLLRLRFG